MRETNERFIVSIPNYFFLNLFLSSFLIFLLFIIFKASNEMEAYTSTLVLLTHLLSPHNALVSHLKLAPGSRLVHNFPTLLLDIKVEKVLHLHFALLFKESQVHMVFEPRFFFIKDMGYEINMSQFK